MSDLLGIPGDVLLFDVFHCVYHSNHSTSYDPRCYFGGVTYHPPTDDGC